VGTGFLINQLFAEIGFLPLKVKDPLAQHLMLHKEPPFSLRRIE
jgi:hypothetical protein